MISAPSVEHPKLIMNRAAKVNNLPEMCKKKTATLPDQCQGGLRDKVLENAT
ncbi:MAG: hypothetical protein J5523_05945 [Muribaculaceae bacterium]|nr:hypothetical protein [Muribaculaceae bacterium]